MKYLTISILVTIALLGSSAANCAIIRGEGDFEFYITLSAFPTDGKKVVELLQVAVPVKELEYQKKGDIYKSIIEIEVVIKDGQNVIFSNGYRIKDERDSKPAAKDISGFVYLTDSCLVDPGEYKLSATVKDMLHKKSGGLFRRSYHSSSVKDIPIVVPVFDLSGIQVSEPILIWSVKGSSFIPNPMGIYGLKNDTLTFFAESFLYENVSEDSVTFNVSILNMKGDIELEQRFKRVITDGRARLIGKIDINTLPAGDYRLIVQCEYGDYVDARAKDFSVSWELVNWQKPQRELLVEARILLDDREYELFKRKSLGEQEKMLDELWKKLDPTPHTAKNEAFEKFMQRLRYADITFGGAKRGALTDRGIIYIRFGPPDEIINQVVPHNRGDLDEAMKKVVDRFHVVQHSFSARNNMQEQSSPLTELKYLKDSQTKLIRGFGGKDTGAYEVWVYNMNGDPILESDKLLTVKQGMRFLFLDKDGYGEFQLIGTSEDMFND